MVQLWSSSRPKLAHCLCLLYILLHVLPACGSKPTESNTRSQISDTVLSELNLTESDVAVAYIVDNGKDTRLSTNRELSGYKIVDEFRILRSPNIDLFGSLSTLGLATAKQTETGDVYAVAKAEDIGIDIGYIFRPTFSKALRNEALMQLFQCKDAESSELSQHLIVNADIKNLACPSGRALQSILGVVLPPFDE